MIYVDSAPHTAGNAGLTFSGGQSYFETQNYFESRLRPGDPLVARIHGTPGYPFGLRAGLTCRLFGKE